MPPGVAASPDNLTADGGVLPVAVVICAYNSGPGLKRAVHAVLAEKPAELSVIDNGSADGSTAFLAPLAAALRGQNSAASVAPATQLAVHVMDRNIGFAAACNAGTQRTQAPLVLFLNDDAVVRPGYLATLCQALAQRPDAASAIGKVVYYAYGQPRIDSAGIELVRHALRPQDRGQDERDVGQYDAACDIFAPTGAAALYRRAALRQVGGFDAALFAYYEDVDLAWKLGRAGWRHLYRPEAVVVHRRRGPERKPPAVRAQAWCNRYTVWARNERPLAFAGYAPVALAWEGARLLRLAHREPALGWAIVRRLAGGLRPGS